MAATAQRRANRRARFEVVMLDSQTRVAVAANASTVSGRSGATDGAQPVTSASECKPEKLEIAAEIAETVRPRATHQSLRWAARARFGSVIRIVLVDGFRLRLTQR